MSNDKKQVRAKMLLYNYLEAKINGPKQGFDIATVVDDQYEHFYICVKPLNGLYKNQTHIIEMRTIYKQGDNNYSYPINPPYMRFITKIYHTNISVDGAICLDILKNHQDVWRSTYSFCHIMSSLMILFEEPNNASPFNPTASRDYVACEETYKSECKKAAERYGKLSIVETDKIYMQCFKSFIAIAEKEASKNLDQLKNNYSKWFPAFKGDKPDNIEEIQSMFESLTLEMKKKKQDVEEKKPENKPNRWAKYQKG
jgi:ubiquitin-protein ligase